LPTPEASDAAEPNRGRAARWPWAIPPRGWKDILWRAWNQAGVNRLGVVAGGVTFYLLLAAFPALAAFVSVYGLFMDLGGVEQQLNDLSRVFPRQVVDLIGQEMVHLTTQKHADLSTALITGALASVWSANAGMKALFDGLNVAYGEREKRPYLLRSLITYGATLGTLMLLVAVTLLTVAAPLFLHAIGLHRIAAWFAPLRWLTIYLLAAGGFTLVYRMGPSRRAARWRWVVCGGAGAALAWMVGSMGFTAYLNNFTHFGATYGSLGAVIGFMLWVWFTVMVVLWGAELNAAVEHQTAQDTTIGARAPLGARGAVVADTVGPAFTVSPREARDFLGRQVGYVAGYLGLGRHRDPL
jgi:membrane protein